MPDMTGIPNSLHVCAGCEQDTAEGLDDNGLPNICDDCKVERTLLAIYYHEVKQMEDGA